MHVTGGSDDRKERRDGGNGLGGEHPSVVDLNQRGRTQPRPP